MSYAGPERRASTSATDNRGRILELMRENPGDLGILSVLLDISQAIESNTQATDEIAKDLREHRSQYVSTANQQSELISQIRGGNRVFGISVSVLSVVGAAVIALAMWIAKDAIDDSRDQGKRLQAAQADIAIIKVRQSRVLEDIVDHERRIQSVEQRQPGGSRGP